MRRNECVLVLLAMLLIFGWVVFTVVGFARMFEGVLA